MLRHLMMGLGLAVLSSAAPVSSGAPTATGFRFNLIEGGELALADLSGGPVLVVNTASRCGFTYQYDGLQALYDRYQDQGLTVIGVSSNSFRQELKSAEAVKEFCEVNFSITFPITEITPVIGAAAHPFYAWAREKGATPNWNFTKILLDGEGRLIESFGSTIDPLSPRMTRAIDALLTPG